MEKARIEQVCEEVLAQAGYESGELDVITLARNLGFTIGLSPLSKMEDGYIIIDRERNTIKKISKIDTERLICVNSERKLAFKRFILAHELGHYFLHYLNTPHEVKGYFAHRENKKGKDEYENDADYFAACLLMPKEHFKQKYSELREESKSTLSVITSLSNYFNTPIESILRRIDEVFPGNSILQKEPLEG